MGEQKTECSPAVCFVVTVGLFVIASAIACFVVASKFNDGEFQCVYDDLIVFFRWSSALLITMVLTAIIASCFKEGAMNTLGSLISASLSVALFGIGIWGITIYDDIPYPGPSFDKCDQRVWATGILAIVTDMACIGTLIIFCCFGACCGPSKGYKQINP